MDEDDVWGELEAKGGDDPHLEREWEARRQEFWNSGYREGLEAGKQETVQAGFNEGYASGAAAGKAWGTACGAAATLAAFAARVPGLAGVAQQVQQLNQRLAGMLLPQVTVAVCRHLAEESVPRSASSEGHGIPSPAPEAPPPGHMQHAQVQEAMEEVDATLASLGLRPPTRAAAPAAAAVVDEPP